MGHQVLTKLDYELVQKIPHAMPSILKIEIMFWNIWRQFGVTSKNSKKLKIHDFSWTPKVRREFYDIFPHRHLLRRVEKKGELEAWVNICEPELYDN